MLRIKKSQMGVLLGSGSGSCSGSGHQLKRFKEKKTMLLHNTKLHLLKRKSKQLVGLENRKKKRNSTLYQPLLTYIPVHRRESIAKTIS